MAIYTVAVGLSVENAEILLMFWTQDFYQQLQEGNIMFRAEAETDNAVNRSSTANTKSKWMGRIVTVGGNTIYETGFDYDYSSEAIAAAELNFTSALRHMMEMWQNDTGNTPVPEAGL